MSQTEENINEQMKPRKKRKRNSREEKIIHKEISSEEKPFDNTDSKERKNSFVSLESNESSQKSDFDRNGECSLSAIVNNNDGEQPIRKKKKKKSKIEQIVDIVHECVEQISKTKKVSFNDAVRTFTKVNKNTKGNTFAAFEQPPKSILKHTDFKNESVADTGKVRKKTKNKSKLKVNSLEANSTCKKRDKALQYLKKWKVSRETWKFEKLSQTWLLKNMFDKTQVPDDDFHTLLEYIVEMTGAAVTLAKKLCSSVIEKKEKDLMADTNNAEGAYDRAISVLQQLK